MPSAEIITIGTELLLGDKQDTNTQFIAHALRDLGLDLYRTTMIGDNADRIAQAIIESLQRTDIIITTGGLGPTVDDPTRSAIAQALGQDLIFQEDLWQQIQERFQRWQRTPTENNRRQAYLPGGAVAIENPVGTAPAFRASVGEKTIICLPGVPREMEEILISKVAPYLRDRYTLNQTLTTYTMHVAGMGESQVDEIVGDLETLSNPTVGLLAHAGQIDIRLTAKEQNADNAMQLIMPVVEDIRGRLGMNIYGEQDITLEEVISDLLSRSGLCLGLVEAGMGGSLLDRLSNIPLRDPVQYQDGISPGALAESVRSRSALLDNCVILGASACKEDMKFDLHFSVFNKGRLCQHERSYGGPPASASSFAATLALDYLRRLLIDPKSI
jgi:competence/damage-inducible protein CinA-like protein